MTYEEQQKIEQINKQILNNIIESVSKEEFISFYQSHNRKETMQKYGIRTGKQLTKILKIFNYDFSFHKSLNKGKPATRSHESYVSAGKKSAETQKQNWTNKSDLEKKEWSDKQKKSHNTKQFREKIKQINIDYQKSMTPEQKEKQNLQRSEKCKKTWETNREKILEQSYAVKKQNNSFNSSQPEDMFYQILIKQFGTDNVIRQYTDTERYPFACDFYIIPTDTFIELNLSWTHGGHRFDNENEDDLQKLSIWQKKAETSQYYENAIKTWTIRDVQKFEVAEKNNLNYIVYYREDEFIK